MNTKQAITSLKHIVTNCDPQRLQDIATILELGAGNLFLEDKTDKRHSIIIELVDAIAYSTFDENDEYQPQAEFTAVYAGSWELVLASLVLDADWARIAQTAQELTNEQKERHHE